MAAEVAERLAAQARAFGDPTRLTLAVALREGGELRVCDLAWIVERSQRLVSHHLRLLRAERLVRSRRAGKLVFYALTEAGAALLAAVVGEAAPLPA
jgi:DNA-binding transcriptional ArsR family regulator